MVSESPHGPPFPNPPSKQQDRTSQQSNIDRRSPPTVNRSTKPTSMAQPLNQLTVDHVIPSSAATQPIPPPNYVTQPVSHVIPTPPTTHMMQPTNHMIPVPPTNHVMPTPISSHVTQPSNHMMPGPLANVMPHNHVTNHMFPDPSTNYTTQVNQGYHMTPSTNHVTLPFPMQPLPPAPSVNLPLDLEGRDLILSHDLEPQQPLEFLDDWYPTTDMRYSDYPQNNEDNTQMPLDPQQHYEEPHPQLTPPIVPMDATNNPRVAYGPLPTPPSYNQALELPSHFPVQPPLPPPVSIVTTEEKESEPVSGTGQTGLMEQNEPVKEKKVLDEREKEPAQTEKEIEQKRSEFVREQVHLLMEEERKRLEEERAKMKEELREEREKDKAALAKERERQNIEFKERTKEMEKQLSTKLNEMKQEYEKERLAMLKQQDEMKHYWESLRQQNQQQRQVVINQVSNFIPSVVVRY